MEPTMPTPDQSLPAMPQPPKKGKGRMLLIVVIVAVLIGAVSYLIVNRSPAAGDKNTARVTISAGGLNPATIKVKKGQSVTWVNQDTQTHQIASDPYPAENTLPDLNSQEPLAQGESYTYSFDKAGTYTYHDHLKPLAFKGTVIVE